MDASRLTIGMVVTVLAVALVAVASAGRAVPTAAGAAIFHRVPAGSPSTRRTSPRRSTTRGGR